MPIYNYECDHCGHNFEISHGMFFIQDVCVGCGRKEGLSRCIPHLAKDIKPESFEAKVGEEVKKHIEEAKKETKREKKRLKKRSL